MVNKLTDFVADVIACSIMGLIISAPVILVAVLILMFLLVV